MAMTPNKVTLVAAGVLYRVQIEIEDQDLDWLDQTILEVCETPRSVDELIRSFELPDRLMQDALARLIELHLLLLDVVTGTVEASGLPLRFHRAHSEGDDVWIWQDYATGSLIPWGLVQPWAAKTGTSSPPTSVQLKGGPPARTVVQMSEAELLMHLEHFRRDTAWSQRVSAAEMVRSVNLRIPATQRADGRLIPDDANLPTLLVLRWNRLGSVLPGAQSPGPQLRILPQSWSEAVGAWSQAAHLRLHVLLTDSPALPASIEPPAEIVRQILERDARLGFEEVGWDAVRSGVGSARKIAVAVSERFGTFGRSIAVIREAKAARERTLLCPVGAKLNPNQRERASAAAIRLGEQPRRDQDFALADDCTLVFGASTSEQVVRVLTIKWRRPLLAYVAWFEERGLRTDKTDLLRAESDELDKLIARLRSFEQTLEEQERVPPPAPTDDAAPKVRSSALARLQAERAVLETELLARNPVAMTVLEPEQLIQLIQEAEEPIRVVVRDLESPLAVAAQEQKTLEAVVVWDPIAPKVDKPGIRWVREPGFAEIVLIGDIVAVGCWITPGTEGMPPFIAIHSSALAAFLRRVTALGELVKPFA